MNLTEENKKRIDEYFDRNSKEYIFRRSLELNQSFIESLSKEELDALMKPFDEYEIE